MIAQRNGKLEKMISMGKNHGDRRGLGLNSNVNHTSSSQKTNNIFMKVKCKDIAQASYKGKEKVSSLGHSQRSYGVERKESTLKVKAPLNQGEVLGKPKPQPYSYTKAA